MLTLTGRFLVMPDVHQNLDWVEEVLAEEASNVEGVVFLGDYFDAKISNPPSPQTTADYFLKIEKRLGKPVALLVGNHDLPYLYDIQKQDSNARQTGLNPYSCSHYHPHASEGIAAKWTLPFRSKLRAMVMVNGYLLSHAGLHSDYLPNANQKALEELDEQLRRSLETLTTKAHPALASVSPARGGTDPVGGVTWQDWHQEFEDSLPWPQIVGHTALETPQQNGRSWNLDTRGHHYALLDEAGIDVREA